MATPDAARSDPGWRRPRVDGALVALALALAATRFLFYLAGVRFDASTLPWFWQYLDPAWLSGDLMRSLWYLHAQPPLFNAFLGLVLKLGGGVWMFQATYFAVGLGLVLALYALMRRLGVGRGLAFGAALVYDTSSTAILYENWLFYPLFEATGLVAAALFLHRLCVSRRTRDAALFFACVAALALTRSLFHAVWFAACAALALAGSRPLRRGAVACCALASLAVGGLYAKNAWLFGSPFASSWFGMSLAGLTQRCWPDGDLEPLIERGEVSPLIRIAPFSALDRYPESIRRAAAPNVPALRERARESGEPNYNHIDYLAISRQYERDAGALIRIDPARYAFCVRAALRRYLLPPSDIRFVDANRQSIAGLDRVYAALVYGVPNAWRGQPPRADTRSPVTTAPEMCWLWLAAGSLACVQAALVVIRSRKRATDPNARARAVVLGFCLFNVAFVTFVANAVELGENSRFRVAIEPILTAMIAFAANQIAQGRRRVAVRPDA